MITATEIRSHAKARALLSEPDEAFASPYIIGRLSTLLEICIGRLSEQERASFMAAHFNAAPTQEAAE